MNKELPKLFDLSVINLISSNVKNCQDFDLLSLNENHIEKIYNAKNFLLMDAYDEKSLGFYKNEHIYSNAIFF